MDDWPSDPTHNWPRHFKRGDFVRLADGRAAFVHVVEDYAPDPPSRWELIVEAADANGHPDVFIVEPWDCRPDPEAGQELSAAGIV